MCTILAFALGSFLGGSFGIVMAAVLMEEETGGNGMTDVLIKNWCIPECCMDCDPDFAYAIKCKAYNENNNFTRQRAENCPLVEIKHSQDGDTIYRADAIEAIASLDETDGTVKVFTGRQVNEILSALPSAEAEPTVIRSRTFMPTKDFKEWEKRIRETNPNAVVIPCDAEVVSAEAVQGEWLYRRNDVECSVCGEFAKDKSNFCPNCGAKMKGGSE
ncbi:MAG: hypothetical protein IKE74_09020 [Mogibacterium sp.]|nr:hypothetical protein [Mogibacterium sp.]